jgi:hypothetical protein
MCEGVINFSQVQADTYVPRDCCEGIGGASNGGSGSSIDLCSSTINLNGADGYTYIDSKELTHVTGDRSVSLAGSGLTIDNGELGSIEMRDYYAFFTDKVGQNKGEISGGYIKLYPTESTGGQGCGRTEISPGKITFIGTDTGSGTNSGGANNYTEICKDDVNIAGTDGTVRIYNGAITCGNNSEADTGYDNTHIDKGTITVTGMDNTTTTINGATITQEVEPGNPLNTYIYPGTIESTGDSAKMVVEDGAITLSTTNTGTTVKIDPNGLPANTYIYFQQIDICVDGKTKKAWVLMSDPQDSSGTATQASSDTTE